jgi:hypothetical protein
MILVAFAYAFTAFCIWFAFSLFGWRILPYRDAAETPVNQIIWAAHAVFEKVGSLIITCIISVLAARTYRPTWKIGILTALITALLFQFIAIAVYIVRWGFVLYWTYNRFFSTLFYTVAIGYLCGFVALWGQYRRDKKAA